MIFGGELSIHGEVVDLDRKDGDPRTPEDFAELCIRHISESRENQDSMTIRCEEKFTSQEWREYIKKLAEEDFKDHVFSREGEGRWYCGKPGTSIYHFRVVVSPGTIILFGDIYDLILHPSDSNALGWLRSVLHPNRTFDNVGYFMEKVNHVLRNEQKVFLLKDAWGDLEEERRQAQEYEEEKELERIKEWEESFKEKLKWSDGSWGACGEFTAWAEAYCESKHDSEGIDSPLDFDSMLLVQFHALRTFVRLLIEMEEKEAMYPPLPPNFIEDTIDVTDDSRGVIREFNIHHQGKVVRAVNEGNKVLLVVHIPEDRNADMISILFCFGVKREKKGCLTRVF